ncbi:Regulatory protein of adaptative response [Rickettsiales bacterium Ac37b]|nr:Regulatory protein of adaptative response [Rickettsiales bacterium Ac37b]
MDNNRIIQYIIKESILGFVLVAQSNKGVCAVFIGNNISLLVSSLQNKFSKIILNNSDQALQNVANQIISLIANPTTKLNVEMEINGTEFQQKIWKMLQEIPVGETISYKELARRAGNPMAIRAAANACASNLLAIIIPCHRVIKSNGMISGYRWGQSIKQQLLKNEVISIAI